MLRSNKTRIVTLEQARGARARRYFDEEAEAKAQGLPCVLVPRELSREEWIEQYSPPPKRVQVINDRTGHMASASTRRLALSNE